MIEYQKGQIIKGIVTGFERYGIFLSFPNNYTGMIHISELSDNFVKDVKDYATKDEEIPCIILEIDKENKKLKCSIKNTKFSEEKDRNINHGFAPLRQQLPIWMEEQLKEMKEKE